MAVEIRVPNIGDFKNIPIIEIHVQPGASVSAEDPLITLESDKATLDVPAPQAGRITALMVKLGDRVSEGDVIMMMEAAGAPEAAVKETVRQDAAHRVSAGRAGQQRVRAA